VFGDEAWGQNALFNPWSLAIAEKTGGLPLRERGRSPFSLRGSRFVLIGVIALSILGITSDLDS
jgi:hypothetical protein